MRIDLTLFSEAMAVVVLYYLFLFLRGAQGVKVPAVDDQDRPLVVVVIPARNEELVIEESIRSVLACTYRGSLRVVVVDDGSSDRTVVLAEAIVAEDPRVRVLRRSPDIAGTGKSDVLNHAFGALCRWHEQQDPWLGGYSTDSIVLCILDADGHLSPTALNDGTSFFSSSGVGAVQIGVQIRNARESLLARLQDMEFVGFSFMVQTARDRIGSVGLGGNGQFTRMSALAAMGGEPWSSTALTEDLDLGLRLMMSGWRLRFCSSAWVDQQGVTRLKPLLRQRTRWAQGHYQCWRHLPALLRSRHLSIRNRLDTLAYLSLIAMVMIVSVSLILRILGAFSVVDSTNTFLPFLGTGLVFRSTIFTLSWLPIWLTLATYQRFAVHPLRWWEWPTYCLLFAVYIYLWAVATLRAWARFVLGRRNWVKTPRVGLQASRIDHAEVSGVG